MSCDMPLRFRTITPVAPTPQGKRTVAVEIYILCCFLKESLHHRTLIMHFLIVRKYY